MNAMEVARRLQLEKNPSVRRRLQSNKSGKTSKEKLKEKEIAVADGPTEEITAPPLQSKNKRATKRNRKEIDTNVASKPLEKVTSQRAKATIKKENEVPDKKNPSRRIKKSKGNKENEAPEEKLEQPAHQPVLNSPNGLRVRTRTGRLVKPNAKY